MRILTLFALALALAACGGAPPPAAQAPPPPPPPPDAPTATPTAMPTANAPAAEPPTPTANAPAADQPAYSGVLPAPLYALAGEGVHRQIARLEPDGRTIAQVTFEPQPVGELDVAADAGTLVYLYGDDSQRTLVALDGGGRRELLAGQLSAPRVSPDGQTVAVHIDSPEPGLIAGQDAPPAGVWAAPTGGGRPSLLLADDSAEGQQPPDGTAWTYTPVGYDRGGQRLLLWAYNMAGPAMPGGELVILSLGGGALVRSGPTCCEGAAWSVDGSAVTIVGGGPGPDMRYGLYRVDAADGAEQALIAQGDSGYPLVTGARQLLDGAAYAFYEDAPGDGFSWDYPFSAQMVRVGAGGAITPLRQDSYTLDSVLWRDDASGALVSAWDGQAGDASAGRLIWLDSSGGAAAQTAIFAAQPRWADTVRPLYEGDCAALPAVAWQPAQSRAFSSGAADLQARLGARGLDAGLSDGYFGDQTRAALRQFQASRGLPPGDALDCATWQALLGRP